ncbi:MAG: M36 family metallopeptidase [Acidobacteria bacterium]|nr:M36 family metallopeptidase [Acidobacteriota bacterium]
MMNHSLRLSAIAVAMGAALSLPSAAPAGGNGHENKRPAADMDIRDANGARAHKLAPGAGEAAMTAGQGKALGALRKQAADLEVAWSALTGAPNRIHSMTKTLTGPSGSAPADVAAEFLGKNLSLFRLSPADVSENRFSRDFVTRSTGVTHLTIQQRAHGLDVFGAMLNVNVDAEGRIVNVAGELLPDVHASANTKNPKITADEAANLAADASSVTKPGNIPAGTLVFFPMEIGRARLAWDLTVDDAETNDSYRTIVDATDGTVLWRHNLTSYNHLPTHGQVYTGDSPNPDFPVGSSTGIVARVDAPFTGDGFYPHADPHEDWWNGGPDPGRTTTTSNNVFAQDDRDGDNTGGFRPTAGAGESFTYAIDLTMDPKTYTSAALANLFYWNNRLHDLYYQLGFDEASGNFQVNNFGLGGAGNDPVLADAQDNRDANTPSLCNANFNTPADGTSPRMQMFQCNKTSPERDGDLDNHVIAHEFTHGVHSRLVPTLTGFQEVGEGWADFMGLTFLVDPTDGVDAQYVVGEWLFGFGIRRQAYTTDQTVFTRTYANLTDGATCAVKVCSNNSSMTCTKNSDCGGGNTCNATGCQFDFQCQPPATAINQGLCSPEVHNTGELWAETLWIARANLVKKYGWATGNRTIQQDVIDGMKMSAPMPDFLDDRDAILLADVTDNGGVNVCLLWDAFARMGLGVSAVTLGPNDINPIQAFDLPSACTPNVRVNASLDFGNVCIGGSAALPIEVFNTGTGDLIVNSVSQTSGSSSITVDPNPATPLDISADAHVDFTARCAPASSGTKTAKITVKTNDVDQPSIDLTATCNSLAPVADTLIADSGNFGDVCIGSFKDLALTVNNSGGCPLTISGLSSSSADFLVAGAQTLPITVAPGASVQIFIRFQPATFGAKTGTITLATSDPVNSIRTVNVSGRAPSGTMTVTGSTDFGDVCAGAQAEKTLSVCNTGSCDLHVTSVAFSPACADFTLVNNPFPATVSHDFCLGVVIRFTPTSAGPKSCTLVIMGDDPVTPVKSLTVTANTPVASIDVPPDLGFPATVIQSVGACKTPEPFPVSNKGQCNLNITNFAITNDPAEYSLAAVPSFPIILQPGHVAGDGALQDVFGPVTLDRARTGNVTVTYESDPITHATQSVTRAMCGEAVRTGARVLVRAGGVPLAVVTKIQLQRINANRNKNLLDTNDVVFNAALQTVVPGAPCAPFQFHREYGTVSNPIQLLPGSYQVTVSANVNGKKVSKTVGFSVDTCGFNQNIIVDF